MSSHTPTMSLLNLWAHLPGLYWVINPEAQLIAISNSYLELMGETSTSVHQKNIFSLFEQQPFASLVGGTELLKNTLEKVRSTGQEERLIAQGFLVKDTGQKTVFDLLFIPVSNENNQLEYIIHQAVEVTSRQADETYKEANIYRTIAANMPQGAVFMVDRNFRYVLAEGKALQDAGIAPADIEGKTIWEAPGAKLTNVYESNFRRALSGKPFRHEHESHGHHYISHGTPLRNEQGKIYAVLVVSYNITERKQAEEELRVANQRFEIIAQTTNDAVWDWNLQTSHHHLWWNDSLQTLFGYAPEQIPSRIDWWSERIHPEDRRRVIEGIQQVIDRGGQKWSDEYRFINADGTVSEVFDRGFIIRDGKAKPLRMLGGVTDITERKRREANQAFLAEVTEEFSRLTGTDEILQVVGECAHRFLNVSQAYYCDIDDRAGMLYLTYLWNAPDAPMLLQNEFAIADFLNEEFGRASRAGETLVVRDTETNPCVECETYRAIKMRSAVCVPFHHAGVWRFELTLGDKNPRDWRTDEIEVIEELANRLFPRLERAHAEEAMRKSEEKYHTLFDSIDEGYALCDVIYDENKQPVDFRFLEVNPSFERLTGLKDATGKTTVELIPATESYWFETLAKVAQTGESIRFELYAGGLNRWFDAYASPVGGANSHQVAVVFNNITERKLAEAALYESEERFRLATEAAQMYSWEIDVETQKFKFSENTTYMLNFPHPSGLPKNVEEKMRIIHPDDRDRIAQEFEQALAEADTFMMEYRVVNPAKDILWLEKHGRVMRDGNNKPVRIIGIAQNITDRKQAETELLENQARLKLSMETNRLGSWELDLQTEEMTASDTCKVNFGVSPDTGFSYEDLYKYIHPEDRERVRNAVRQSIEEDGYYEIEYRTVWPDESIHWILARGRVFYAPDNTPLRLIGVTLDMTERRNMEETLHQREEHLELIMKSAKDYAIFTLDKDGKVIDWNTGAEWLLGYSKEEIIGQKGDIIFTPEDRETEPKNEMRIAAEEGRAENERWHIRKDGSRFWGSGYTVPLRNGKGTDVRGFLKIMRDNTERQKMEASLLQAKEDAEQAGRAKEDFLAHMSHEIRTPLNAIVGLANLLLQQQPKPEQLENLQTLRFSAQNLMALVNDILDFSKVQAGKIVIEHTDLNLQEMFHSLQRAHQPYCTEQGNELQFHVDKQLPKIVSTDPLKLSQIMHNLIGNAVKFTQQGLVTVEVSLNRQEGDQLWVDFSVSDTGIGIPEDKLSSIFDTFTQANNATVRQFGGTGLGLSITKLLLELMDSHIQVESQEGKGSRFFFTLPMLKGSSTDHVTDATILSEEAQTGISDIKLLLVEDTDINRMILKQFLEDWWQLVPDEAINGEQALEMAQATQYDIILMDVRMPVMDGYQTAQAIRALSDKTYRQVPIIALTADTEQELKKHAEAAAFTDVVTKPFDPQDLRQKILRYATGKKTKIKTRRTSGASMKIDTKQVEALFKGDNDTINEFYEKATTEFSNLREQLAIALAQRNIQMLSNIKHKSTLILNILTLDELKELLNQSIMLVEKNATHDKIDQVRKEADTIIEQVLGFLKQQQHVSE